jgi:hypothetical protein
LWGQTYDPEYVLEFESTGNGPLDSNAVLFKSFIRFEEITLGFISVFFGRIERIRENTFLGRFNRSELLGDYVLEALIDADGTLEAECDGHVDALSKKGFIVLK